MLFDPDSKDEIVEYEDIKYIKDYHGVKDLYVPVDWDEKAASERLGEVLKEIITNMPKDKAQAFIERISV